MTTRHFPLRALRAFEVAARFASFTRAAEELHVTPAAISLQVRQLEDWLGVLLFERHARGIRTTPAARALQPIISEAFIGISEGLEELRRERGRPIVIGAVGTFAVGWLLPRMKAFAAAHPLVRVHVRTHNNRNVDLVRDGLDMAVRFGSGRWAGHCTELLMRSQITPLCSPGLAGKLGSLSDLRTVPLLSTYHSGDWPRWLRVARVHTSTPIAAVFDSSLAMIHAALADAGVAIADPRFFARQIAERSLVQPFPQSVSARGAYWLTWLSSPDDSATALFRDWLIAEAKRDIQASS